MLSQREKNLIALLVAVVVGLALFWGIRAVQSWEFRLAARITARESTLRRAEALSQELARLNRIPRGKRLKEPLIGYVERLAKQVGVDKRIQLNLIPQDRDKSLETVEAKVESLTLDEMVKFLHVIEDADPPLVIDQFELSPSFRSRDLLRVTLRVLARK